MILNSKHSENGHPKNVDNVLAGKKMPLHHKLDFFCTEMEVQIFPRVRPEIAICSPNFVQVGKVRDWKMVFAG